MAYKEISLKLPIERTAWVDNIRGILIFCVVFGHLIAGEPSQHSDMFGISHYLIYSVHMPIFMLVSGFLSKKQSNVKKILKNYLIPYIIFDLLYALYRVAFFKQPMQSFNIFFPITAYWFILCLAWMKFLLFLNKGKYKYMLWGGVILISLLSPLYIKEEYWRFLSLGRLVLLWPIFSIGICMQESAVKFFVNKRSIAIFLGLLCVGIELLLLTVGIVDISWATHDYPNSVTDALLRYVFMLFSIGCFFALASVMQNPLPWIAQWGKNSILIYLLHLYFTDISRFIISKLGLQWNVMLYILLLLAVVLMCQFISMGIWRKSYNNIMDKIACALHIC